MDIVIQTYNERDGQSTVRSLNGEITRKPAQFFALLNSQPFRLQRCLVYRNFLRKEQSQQMALKTSNFWRKVCFVVYCTFFIVFINVKCAQYWWLAFYKYCANIGRWWVGNIDGFSQEDHNALEPNGIIKESIFYKEYQTFVSV